MTVVFRVAAGPHQGFGHLVRCRSLARALGVAPRVSIRGGAATRARASRLGWHVLPSTLDVLAARPSLLVVDDPSAASASRWVRAARRRGIAVVSIHDLGLAPVPSQLSVDGSVGRTAACGTTAALRGPRFAVLDPAVAAARARGRRVVRRRVLVALGGGVIGRRVANRVVAALTASRPDLDVRVAAGFAAGHRQDHPTLAGRLVHAPRGLAGELSRAAVAVVGGGITLYEACALGVPVVAVAVTAAQRPTVRAFAGRGAARAALDLRDADSAGRIARQALQLLDEEEKGFALGQRGRQLVDGRGAWRVASAARRLVATADHDRARAPRVAARSYADAA